MKIRILVLLLLWIISITHRTQAAFEGFRVGGNFGLQLLQGKHYYTGPPPGYPATDMMKRISTLSAIYGGHLGYLLELGPSKIVVGAEAYIFLPQANPQINLFLLQGNGTNGPQEGTVSINHNRSIGFSLIAGMMFNPKVMLYALAGLERARFQFIYKFTLLGMPPKIVYNHFFNAFNVGLGGTYKITPHFLLGAELSSPFFRRYKISNSGLRGYNYKPSERRLMLKVSYLF